MKIGRVVTALAATAAALIAATTASGAHYAPAAQGLPFVQLASPSCFNGPLCYSPQQIQQAYDFPNGRGAPTGAGQTIVVVDAFGSPFLGQDLANFDQAFGLPPIDFAEVDPQNVLAGLNQTWALETSLDVEWAHALAPGAKIVLAVAASDDGFDLYQAELDALAQYPNAILVQSFGADEAGPYSSPDGEAAFDQLFAQQIANGGTVIAASGDFGASNFLPLEGLEPTPMASYPASSPLVLSVGGTMGDPVGGLLDSHGHYGGEQVWNEPDLTPLPGASGGAPSVVYPRPIWQFGAVSSRGRAEPDVAFNAAKTGGAVIAFGGKFGVIAGTSVGAPSWAAIVALANELRAKARQPQVGLVTPLLYLLARDKSAYRQDFHDITVGSNALLGPDSGLPGFNAGPGYDYPTGLGTPDVARLIHDLAGRDAQSLRLTGFFVQHGHGHGDGYGRFAPGR